MFGNIELGAAAEFDHADALAAIDHLAGLHGANDPPGDQADDLLHHYDRPAIDRITDHHRIRFILLRGVVVAHGVDELSLLVVHRQHFAVAGGAIHVHVENGKKDP